MSRLAAALTLALTLAACSLLTEAQVETETPLPEPAQKTVAAHDVAHDLCRSKARTIKGYRSDGVPIVWISVPTYKSCMDAHGCEYGMSPDVKCSPTSTTAGGVRINCLDRASWLLFEGEGVVEVELRPEDIPLGVNLSQGIYFAQSRGGEFFLACP